MHHHHRDRREEQHEGRREERREVRHDEYDNYDTHRGQRHHDVDAPSYPSHVQGQGQGWTTGGYAPPPGVPSAQAFASQGGLERADFLSDTEIDRRVASGEFGGRQRRRGYDGNDDDDDAYGSAGGERRYDAPSGPPPGGRANEHGRYDAPSGPPPGQGYGERTNEYSRYDTPSGPPPGRGYQSQQPHQGYGLGGGPDRQNQYGSQQQHGRSQYDAPQALHTGTGRSQGNAPSGGFTASRDGEEQYGSGYGGQSNDRNETPRRGEAASYYDQQGSSGQGDRYAHLAGMVREHGDDDPELYRQATHGLHDRIQAQAQVHRSDDDLKSHVDAHRKAYGQEDHGPMDADAIGAAAAMEAFKQTAAAGSSKAPAGGFQTGKASGNSSSKLGRAARDEEAEEEEEEETTATRAGAGASGGMQDKLMAIAMSQAGKLFDKKNAGSSGGDKTQGKAQAMQSAAATAMQLFTQYQSKGKIDSGDMSQMMSLAMKML